MPKYFFLFKKNNLFPIFCAVLDLWLLFSFWKMYDFKPHIVNIVYSIIFIFVFPMSIKEIIRNNRE